MVVLVAVVVAVVVRGSGRDGGDGEMYGEASIVVVVLGFLEEVARRVRTLAASKSP